MRLFQSIPRTIRALARYYLVIGLWLVVGCRSEQAVFRFEETPRLTTYRNTAAGQSNAALPIQQKPVSDTADHKLPVQNQATLYKSVPAQPTVPLKGHSRKVIGKSRDMVAKMHVLAKLSTAQRKSATSPQEMDLDFLIIPFGVFCLGVLLLAVALVGTWFGGAMGTLAIIGAATVALGFVMALIPIANASSKCFYCLQ